MSSIAATTATAVEEDLYGGSDTSFAYSPSSFPMPAISYDYILPDMARNAWFLRLRPIRYSPCQPWAPRMSLLPPLIVPALVEGKTYAKCRVDPVPTEDSILSHIRIWENGTFLFHPVDVKASPCVFIGLDERPVGTEAEDIDLQANGFDIRKPFTICETRTEYKIDQRER